MEATPNLFAERVPINWLPNETLFSLCSRYHILSGNHRASSTCERLFGHPKQGSAHDLPSRIGEFVSRTGGQLGTAHEIIYQRTLLPIYLPFLSAEELEEALAALAGTSIGSLKYKLGLTASRFGANHPLKACLTCSVKDIEEHGVAYWHLSHQWPGVVVCPVHRTPLLYSNLKATGVQRFQWVLPRRETLIQSKVDIGRSKTVVSMAMAAIQLAKLPPNTYLEAGNVIAAYRAGLEDRGLLKGASKNSLYGSEIGRQYLNHLAPLLNHPEFRGLPTTPDAAYKEVAKLSSGSCLSLHPIRHLALITWLYPDFESFLTQSLHGLGQFSSRPSSLQTTEEKLVREDERKIPFLRLVASGLTVSAASHSIGIDPITGMAWAANQGISVEKRPSLVKGEAKTIIVSALRQGASKESVAKLGSVSVASVTRLLRTEVGLQAVWHRAQTESRRSAARKKWLEVVSQNPLGGIKSIRILEPAAYAWLYRNDREWLTEQVSSLAQVKNVGGVTLNWDERDRRLSDEVRLAGLRAAKRLNGKKVRLCHLYQEIPDLKAKISKLDRLPLTRMSIEQVLAARTGDIGQ